MSEAPLITAEVEYPESDCKPMAETEIHRDTLVDLIHGLRCHFRARSDVYVGGNLLLYYEEGAPRKCVAPDVLVTKGIVAGQRSIYQVWKEGKAPDVVFEVTSPTTRWEDQRRKRVRYEKLGVREYYLFDPLGEYLRPALQGYRLTDRGYERLPASSAGTLTSAELGLELGPEGTTLRLVDPTTRARLPTVAESEAGRLVAEARAAVEAEARRVAEERVAAEVEARRVLEAELARLRSELERRSREP
ncbi:MAG: Uma2 family endonuclease [Chloroflexi bacterium]|nr:Uma2 family endonuclease [Chloroflexota bacterium]